MLSEIYEEMRSKYGFNEGATVPEGVEAVRKKIIGLINKGLPKNSLIEACPYDRMGIHNWCLIEYRNKHTGHLSGEPRAEVVEILDEAEANGWSINTKITIKKV
jgi:hypothetical protein